MYLVRYLLFPRSVFRYVVRCVRISYGRALFRQFACISSFLSLFSHVFRYFVMCLFRYVLSDFFSYLDCVCPRYFFMYVCRSFVR